VAQALSNAASATHVDLRSSLTMMSPAYA